MTIMRATRRLSNTCVRATGHAAAMLALAAAAWMLPGPLQAQSPPPVPGDDEIFAWTADIAAFGVRRPGTPGSLKASQYVHDRFREFGLERVAFEEADTKVWTADRWSLEVGGRTLPSSPLQHSFQDGTLAPFSTGPQGYTGELAYVGRGAESDFWLRDVRGKIVVADVTFGKRPLWLFKPFLLGLQDSQQTLGSDYTLVDPYAAGSFPGSYYRAMERGAVGFVGVLTDYFDSHQYRNEAYRAYDPGGAMHIPGLWMSPVAGGRLAKEVAASAWRKDKLQGTVRLEGQLSAARGRAVVGYLPGMTDEIILIQSHHDSATAGATEDASGTASVLALARHFSRIPKAQRHRTLMFATMDTHFTDYAVHKAFARRHLKQGNPLGEKVVAVVTIEHIARDVVPGANREPVVTGQLAPRVMMVSTELPDLKDIALRAMREHRLERTAAVSTSLVQLVQGDAAGIPADSSNFLAAGVPVIAFVGAPLYLYDEIDTLDKVAKEELGRVAGAMADIVVKLDRLPSERFKRLPDRADF